MHLHLVWGRWGRRNFRGGTIWGAGLWRELLRGRESIRQRLLQSGRLLKMQRHNSQNLCVPDCLSVFYRILSADTTCAPIDTSDSAPLHISFSAEVLRVFTMTKMAGVSRFHPICASNDPIKRSHSSQQGTGQCLLLYWDKNSTAHIV